MATFTFVLLVTVFHFLSKIPPSEQLLDAASPYLSPAVFPSNYRQMLDNFKIFAYDAQKDEAFSTQAEILFHKYLLRSPFLTSDPSLAHLFYLSLPSQNPRSIARLIRNLRQEYPFWNQTLGADHFFLSCDGIGIESDRNLVEMRKNSVLISCFPATEGKFIPHKDLVLPSLSLNLPLSTENRHFLGFLHGEEIDKFASSVLIELRNDPAFLVEANPLDSHTYAERLWSSRYCLFFYGSRRFPVGEALRSGCVPVVIADRPIVDLPFSDVLRWTDIAVFLHTDDGGNVKQALEEIPGDRYRKMQASGAQASVHFQWDEGYEYGEGSPGQHFSQSAYEEALDALSSLIIRRTRADGSNKGDRFDLLFDYLKILDLDGPVSEMKIIHVAGTKGKGSTCTFAESILRHCGFRTGLFTSPHLIDVRERFRLDGVEISKEKFLAYFWWCWDRLKDKTNEDVPMPNYFRFLTLLGFKIFAAEQVDVAILEVGLGGKFDATNVVKKPVVCGISSLGYDHMEILGNTLGEIAGEKAGILKDGVPAFTVSQPEEAMAVIKNKASQLAVPLQVAPPLGIGLLNGRQLGLHGDHQYLNAGLAIALCRTWLQKTGHIKDMNLDQASSLPDEFVEGLATANLQGRAQVIIDPHIDAQSEGSCKFGGLVFFLDGAHSPESMEECAKWFSHAVQEDIQKLTSEEQHHTVQNIKQDEGKNLPVDLIKDVSSVKNSQRILLFNCMSVRDPQLLLPRLLNACASHGIYFQKALFVPNQSLFNKVGSHALPTSEPQVDLSWQRTLQRVWENLLFANKAIGSRDAIGKDAEYSSNSEDSKTSVVFSSLPVALKWLRDSSQENRSIRFQVLVTGSLHLVGDLIRLLKK
ncbi:hypothetical protein H6P81_005989 [Aristolochia fimbriata]|uniref:Folylpolyglutamate synthase n=1 Tax=Aristolochia fimbriata TaxID=158543 RepID=A0AAV7EY92_ARIFI|nr:hypothetical protein H6P81_005989 [Aristolochia fimbriata]